ncbi:hypothetical protein D0B54_20535 [Solimonas sp. K1W22B-7]|uniref:AAA family ATPase n=1 Tax=Solimonas sp. K1W22B-7 TaxID=2303331 RepID=UPI000E332AE3|nr:adenylate/guanylate cyclase domain-containing protein [Solimonas sp. K1W22B-7]AXQ30921.1 hypothetical protein D0B54_20535 [Solimonas sp. K1W22B-7]
MQTSAEPSLSARGLTAGIEPEVCARYVPAIVSEHLLLHAGASPAPGLQPLQGAILFADISGFTALTERYAQAGADTGAETLTVILNTYFGRLLSVIQAHGGDVVKFAGDALLALWRSQGEADLDEATARAAAGAMAVQEAMLGYSPGDGVQLTLRAAVGAGPIVLAHIGGTRERWEFLVAGSPLAQVGAISGEAAPGEVLLSQEAARLLPSAEGERLASGALRLRALNAPVPRAASTPPWPAGFAETLRRYIPYAILHRLAAGQTQWLGELRRLTVLFVNLPELRHDLPLARMQQVMLALQQALYRYEGSINKLSVDDKGATLVAALGLPPLAHEDDPARGVQAALAMHGALEALGMRCSIGVTTGRVYCGSVGGEQRREYTIMGDVVNLSARLMQKADGGVLCCAATQAASGELLAYDEGTALQLKGKSQPVMAFRPRLHERRSGPRAAEDRGIIGRRRERGILRAQLARLVGGGSGGVVLVEGEAGIGKSKLLADFRAQLDAQPVESLFGAGDAVERSLPYFAWQQICADCLGLSERDDPAQRRERVQRLLEPQPALLRLAPLLNSLLPLEFPETALTRDMSGEVRAANTQHLVAGLLQLRAAQQPLVLVIEDVHWLDSASWALCLRVAQQVRPLLMVLATRPPGEQAPGEYRQLLQMPATTLLRLEVMSPEESVELVERRLGIAQLPEAAAALIRERAEGHPFFSEELGYALRDAGWIVIEDGVCSLSAAAQQGGEVDLPDTVEGLIMSRIDRLTPQQQLTLKVASVIGRAFAAAVLKAVYPLAQDQGQIFDHLETLESLDLTRQDEPDPEPAYFFKHVITQEVAYDLMLNSQRQQLHAVLAEWYERNYQQDLSRHHPLLAHHWRRAGNAAKALQHLELASEQALRNHANEEVVRFLHEAKDLDAAAAEASTPLRRARWERLLGEAERALGHAPEARAHLEAAIALLGWPMPAGSGGVAWRIVRETLRQFWHRLRPGDGHEAPAAQRELLLEAAVAHERLVMIYYFDADVGRLCCATLGAVNLAENAGGQHPVLPMSYGSMATMAAAVPWGSQGRHYSRRALEGASALAQTPVTTWCLVTVGTFNAGNGNWAEAEAHHRQGMELSERLGDRRRWEEHAGSLGAITDIRGHLAEAIDLGHRLEESAGRRGDAQTHGWGLACRVRAAHSALRPADIAAPLAEAQALLAAHPQHIDLMTRMDIAAAAAQLHLHRGEREAAAQQVAEGLRLVGLVGRPNQYHILSAYTELAEAAVELRRAPALVSARDAARLVGVLRTFAAIYPIGEPRYRRLRAQQAELAGRKARAIAAWHRCLDAAVRWKMPLDEARACLALARLSQDAALAARGRELLLALEIAP